jgi:WD40 repeat protein
VTIRSTDSPAPEPAPPATWSPHWELELGDCPTAVSWNQCADELLVASLAGEVVRVDVAAGVGERVTEHAGGALCAAWSGARVISGGQDGAVAVDGDRQAVGGWVSDVAVSGDERVVAVAHGREISVFDVGSHVPALLHHDRHDTSVTCLRWQPSSHRVLVAGSFERVARSAMSPDGPVPVGSDLELPVGGAIASLDASMGGWWVAGVRGGFAYLWNDAAVATPVQVPTGPWSGRLLGFSDRGDLLATASERMTAVFDFDSTDPLGMPSGMWLTSIGTPTALAWRPRSEQLITAVSINRGADDSGLLVWEPRRSPAPLGFVATARPVEHLAWSSCGDLLAIGFADGTISVGTAPFAVHR